MALTLMRPDAAFTDGMRHPIAYEAQKCPMEHVVACDCVERPCVPPL
jgi:hypothetical protein